MAGRGWPERSEGRVRGRSAHSPLTRLARSAGSLPSPRNGGERVRASSPLALNPFHSNMGLILHAGLERILDVVDLVELDVDDLSADLLHAPDIDGLDDVAGLRIDRRLAARALPGHSLGGIDETFAVGLAAGLLERLVDDAHAVERANGEHVRIASESILVAVHEGRVHRGLMVVVVMEGGDDAEAGFTHVFQRVFRGQFALSENFGLLGIDAALGERFADGRRLRAARGPNVDGVGVGVLGTLDEGGEVLVRHRITRRADDLTARILESLVERGFAVMPGT